MQKIVVGKEKTKKPGSSRYITVTRVGCFVFARSILQINIILVYKEKMRNMENSKKEHLVFIHMSWYRGAFNL